MNALEIARLAHDATLSARPHQTKMAACALCAVNAALYLYARDPKSKDTLTAMQYASEALKIAESTEKPNECILNIARKAMLGELTDYNPFLSLPIEPRKYDEVVVALVDSDDRVLLEVNVELPAHLA